MNQAYRKGMEVSYITKFHKRKARKLGKNIIWMRNRPELIRNH